MSKKIKYKSVLHGDDAKAINRGDAVLKKMSPADFLKKAEPLNATSDDKSIIRTFKDDIKDGDVLGALRLYKKGQDGRHRAKAAKKLGVKNVDVVDYRKKKANGGPVLPLGDDDPNAAFRRLISWSFAVAPLFHRADGGAVDGSMSPEVDEKAIVDLALDVLSKYAATKEIDDSSRSIIDAAFNVISELPREAETGTPVNPAGV